MPEKNSLLPVEPTADPRWRIDERGFTAVREREIESLFTVSNGYLATRGTMADRTPLSSPALLVAGLFARSNDTPGLVPGPDWTRLELSVDGSPLVLDDELTHERILDLRQGLWWRDWRHSDAAGRVLLVRVLRFASRADRHLLVESLLITPENFSARLTVEARLAARGARLVGVEGALALVLEGSHSRAAFACADRIEEEAAPQRADGDAIQGRATIELELGRPRRIDRVLAVATSHDSVEPAAAAVERLRASGKLERLTRAHVEAWSAAWRDCDLELDGPDDLQRALRFAAYHLTSAVNPDDDGVSVGARALTGTIYEGHVFWDTDIYMLPFFVFTQPRAARALVRYRHRTLPAARENARRGGWRGALYAWESADTGDEVTPRFLVAPSGEVIPVATGEQEQHISADVAWGAWSYWQATGDEDFLFGAGLEILVETARFWASRATPGSDGRRHILHVMGPDEYHDAVDDDAYTNGMARWNLACAVEAARQAAARSRERWRELAARLELSDGELAQLGEIAGSLYLPINRRTGLIEQFAGYFALDEIDPSVTWRANPAEVLLERDRVRRSKAIKQPDVVMLLALLWDDFSPEQRAANFSYYDPRTAHGSSLSPPIHALVAARLGDPALAERYFRQTAEIDLANNMGNAAGGVHAGALGGLWQAAVLGFAGVRAAGDGLVVDPHLPGDWRRLRFTLQWRGARLAFTVEPEAVEIEVTGPRPIPISLPQHAPAALSPGTRWVAARSHGAWRSFEEVVA